MIEIDLVRDRQGRIVSYRVCGHSGCGEAGSDVVCAAVSALTQAPLLGLERHLKLALSYAVDEKDGILEVALNSAPDALTEAVLETMYYALKSVADQRPEYVRIHEHRR